jgi:hypothetical protein
MSVELLQVRKQEKLHPRKVTEFVAWKPTGKMATNEQTVSIAIKYEELYLVDKSHGQ